MNKSDFLKQKAITMIKQMHEEPLPEIIADSNMVSIALSAMWDKLFAARQKGRGGWWDKNQCSIKDLKKMLADHVEKGDMADVMNFAGMILVRQMDEGETESAQADIKFPAKYICHWPGQPTACCERHSAQLEALARQMCCCAPMTEIAEPAECDNCVNEANATKE